MVIDRLVRSRAPGAPQLIPKKCLDFKDRPRSTVVIYGGSSGGSRISPTGQFIWCTNRQLLEVAFTFYCFGKRSTAQKKIYVVSLDPEDCWKALILSLILTIARDEKQTED